MNECKHLTALRAFLHATGLQVYSGVGDLNRGISVHCAQCRLVCAEFRSEEEPDQHPYGEEYVSWDTWKNMIMGKENAYAPPGVDDGAVAAAAGDEPGDHAELRETGA